MLSWCLLTYILYIYIYIYLQFIYRNNIKAVLQGTMEEVNEIDLSHSEFHLSKSPEHLQVRLHDDWVNSFKQ